MSSESFWITQYARDRIDAFKESSTYSTFGKLAAELRMSRGRLSDLFHAKKAVLQPRRAALNRLLGILPYEESLMYSTDQSFAKSSEVPIKKNDLIHREPHKPAPDLKTLLNDPALSQEIFADRYPSLHKVLVHAFGLKFFGDAAKKHPHLPGFSYNHFIQLGIIFSLSGTWNSKSLCIGYHRSGTRFEHTKGASILWAASFECNPPIDKIPDSRSVIDDWLARARLDRESARSVFWSPGKTILRTLFEYKIQIKGTIASIRPFGVVTRDERDGKDQRCYSNYVFEMVMESQETFERASEALKCAKQVLSPHNIPMLLMYRDGGLVSWKSDESEGKGQDTDVFATNEGRLNEMDIVAWRGIGHGEAVDFKQTRFHPGFDLF